MICAQFGTFTLKVTSSYTLCVGLYWILVAALAENRPFLHIRIWPKCSRILVVGRICKIAHTNTAMFRIEFQHWTSSTFCGIEYCWDLRIQVVRYECDATRDCCEHLCKFFVNFYRCHLGAYCMQILNRPFHCIEFRQFHEQITNQALALSRFVWSNAANPAPDRCTKPESGTALIVWCSSEQDLVWFLMKYKMTR